MRMLLLPMLLIPHITALSSGDLKASRQMLCDTPLHRIANNNWAEQFPYTPRVDFQLAHNGSELFIRFTVKEHCTMAKIREDNGEVWTDSCVEFFLSLDDSGYYNFEFTPIGKMLLGFRKERPLATHASQEVLQSVLRYPSLGIENFEEKQLSSPWELIVAIPTTALFRHNLDHWTGISAQANVYKCGDKLPQPHYLSWQPIGTQKPDFHSPQFFTKIHFE